MSVQRRQRKKGVVWRVQWRDGQHHRSLSFERKRDAEAFEAKIRLSKRQGDLADLDAGRQRLVDFAQEWHERYAEGNLERNTLLSYASVWQRHILPRLGRLELRQLQPEVIEAFAADMRAAKVGDETIRKSLVVLQGALKRAVVWGRIRTNPVTSVAKPPRRRRRSVRPLGPSTVEDLRALLSQRDATLVSVLAYAGLRPGEALALTWADVGSVTILVEKALAFGRLQDTKTRRSRSVKLLRPLAGDLAAWRLASGRPADRELLFPMRRGGPWTDTAYRNWRARTYAPASRAVGIDQARPYDLRHSFASLLFSEQMNPAEIAEQMGHSLTTLLTTYTHVLEELRGLPPQSAEARIGVARETRVAQM
jgi:integrase